MRALLSYPTHENCTEVVKEAEKLGLDAVAYPGRLTDGEEANCWNADADAAEQVGFPVIKTVCTTCAWRRDCTNYGYLAQLKAAENADVALCTHKRVEYSGFSDLCDTRHYITVHEDAISILRPKCECSWSDLRLIKSCLDRLLNDPKMLNWFGDCANVDDDGNKFHDEEIEQRRDRLYQFSLRLADTVDDLLACLQIADRLTEWSVPPVERRPQGIDRLLFRFSGAMKLQFEGQPWRFVLAAASGELQTAAILVHQRVGKDPSGPPSAPHKSCIGYRQNSPSPACVTWFNDATITADRLGSLLQVPVRDSTPDGRIELRKKAVQVVRDITQQTSKRVVASIVRGLLADRPQFERVGVIGHRGHITTFKTLDPQFAKRIVRTAYFRSGDDRSSNAWHRECDLIIIAGTPRLPPHAIREYLMQVGQVGAAAREAMWGPVRWVGTTESGEAVVVKGRGYHDEDWRRAHFELVRAGLIQAIGRGRGILEDGCEVLVLSNEECGLSLSDTQTARLTASDMKIMDELRRASAENPNIYILGKAAVSTKTLANRTDLSIRQTRDILGNLELRGFVIRVGERGGWHPCETADAPADPSLDSAVAAVPQEDVTA